LSEFDIVLHGHLHKQDSKQQYSPTENTLYLTAGRLDCKEEELSGYSLMQIDTETMEVVVHLRKYYHARKVFDKSLSSAPDGVFTYKLAGMIEKQSTTYQALKLYKDFAKEFIYSDPISLLVSQNNTQGFIVPTLKRRSMLDVPSLDPSSLLKDTQDEDRIELSKVINDNNCYIILGQPKYGKSTILKYFASICLSQQVPNRQIPLFIDMNTLNLQGKKQIFRGLQKSFSEITQNNASIRNSDLSSLLSTNQVLVLVDNLNLLNPRHREVIEIFRNDYVQTKVVLTTNEHTFSAEYSGEGSHFRKNFECVYLHPIDKQSLQTYVNDYLGENITDAEALVDKITHSMQEIGMAKTPFNAMMLLAVLRETTDFNAVNEAVLVERFMELILEKLDFEEIKSDRFDFRNKEDYLSFLAYNLDYINRSSFSEDEYEALVKKYFQQTGFDRNASDFDKLFFSKNILAKEDGEIFFTSSFIPEYYLAKYYLVSGLPEKLSKDLVYLNYTNELVFYAGLKRKDIEVFSTIENDFRGMVQARIDKDEYLVDFTPRVDIDFSEELIKPTSTDRAMITDVPDLGISSNSLELQKKRNRELLPDSQADSTFIYALYLYSKLLRNYEYLSPQEKIDAIKTCILGTNHLIFSFAHAFSEMINTELPLMKGDFESDSVAPEMIERKLNKIANTLYTSVPVTIQTVVATWFASKKLIPQFEKIHHIKELANMNAFIFYAILLDMDTSYEAISSYIKNEPNKNMLRLLYLKFQTSYYYATSKSDENNLFNLIYAIQKKLNPKKMSHSGADEFVDKSKLLKNLKDEKAKKTRFGFPL
jgi:hypothetical protein